MLRNNLLSTVVTMVIAVVLIIPAAMAAEVVQGKCVAIDEEKNAYTIEIYNTTKEKEHPYGRSTSKTIVINYSKAMVGIDPEVGDIIRAAYRVEPIGNMALRVMNITKQDIMKK